MESLYLKKFQVVFTFHPLWVTLYLIILVDFVGNTVFTPSGCTQRRTHGGGGLQELSPFYLFGLLLSVIKSGRKDWLPSLPSRSDRWGWLPSFTSRSTRLGWPGGFWWEEWKGWKDDRDEFEREKGWMIRGLLSDDSSSSSSSSFRLFRSSPFLSEPELSII